MSNFTYVISWMSSKPLFKENNLSTCMLNGYLGPCFHRLSKSLRYWNLIRSATLWRELCRSFNVLKYGKCLIGEWMKKRIENEMEKWTQEPLYIWIVFIYMYGWYVSDIGEQRLPSTKISDLLTPDLHLCSSAASVR